MWHINCLIFLLACLPLVVCEPGRYRISTSPFLHPFVRREENVTGTSAISALTLASDGQSYYTLLKIGDIFFRVALDTGSSDLWIASSDCNSSPCKANPRYPLSYHSPTLTPLSNNEILFNSSYADGTAVQGFVAKERVSFTNLTAEDQPFALITKSNVTMRDATSGLLGLGFPRLSVISRLVTNSMPFIVGLVQRGMLKYPVFGLSLRRNEPGSLTLGAVDGSIVTNFTLIGWNKVVEFSPLNVESNHSSYLHWVIPLSGILVNQTRISPLPSYPAITGSSSLALIDVGTPGIFGPYQDVARIFGSIESARLVDPDVGQWAIPCNSDITLSFIFGQQDYTLQPSDYLIGPASGNPNLCLSWPRALNPARDGIDWQLGTAFLRTVYSIFSYGINHKESPLIGFYPLSETSKEVNQSAISTTLPNYLFSTPIPSSTAPYGLNSSVPAPTGGIVSSELGTSTYKPIIPGATTATNLRLPVIEPSPTVQTIVMTQSDGKVETSVSVAATVTLGVPPGWNGAAGVAFDRTGMVLTLIIIILHMDI